ncbi:cell wall anchor [Sulfurovum sp. TSL6]|uniref:DUF2334 domain-containing protein n=1 Tax=Sulfurovum sp. TSL6 TaxID=2826995 RepID=UPI001CC5C681|nr:DUF2334 domain-containing protein [Sulfurovum sp. TSL6]GIU00779.1 cell wall anchor [Sulfurovum sp. TSL6]
MKRLIKFGALAIFLLLLTSCGGGGSGSSLAETPIQDPPTGTDINITLPVPSHNPPLQNVLIVYDTAGPYGEQGNINALLLENLLGHFDLNITSKPAEQYIANEIVDENITTVFYLGTTYLNDLTNFKSSDGYTTNYLDFFKDIATNNKTTVWINYNLDLLEYEWKTNAWGGTTFEESTGFTSAGTDTNYTRVWYKDTELYKGVIPFKTPDADTSNCEPEPTINNAYACALELNTILISDENKTSVLAEANSTIDLSISNEPYVTHGGNFWFVGDIPFSYMSEEDRYLAFADLLHDMLNIDHNESHKATMRLEDVNAETDPSDLIAITEYMQSQNIPFNVATIPQYKDPYGVYHNEINTTIKLYESDIGTLLQAYYNERLIDIVQHGFSHQLYDYINPYNGVTAEDFEFIRVTDDGNSIYTYEGLSEDHNGTWAKNRILEGKAILEEVGIQAFAWEAPHYMAGPEHYRSIQEVYQIQYSRLIYYPDETDKSKFVGQFYPYIIRKDTYGYYVIPENIHNIEDAPNDGYRTITSDDIIRFSKKLKVVRDSVASFYYHPYLGTDELSKIIPGLQNEGYTFVRATSLVE